MLIGPASVGAFAGVLAAFGIAAMHSEYGNNTEPLFPGVTNWVLEALLAFFVVTIGATVLFGVVPLVLKRLLSRHTRGPDA